MLLDTHKTEIETLLARYASKRSAVLPLLFIAQDSYGHLTDEAIREVADILELPPTDVFEVVGFYTLFYNRPVGTWMVQVCDDVPCCYLGAEETIAKLRQTLGIREEQTTPDGSFTLQRVKCLAACNRAPVVQANLSYIYDVTAERVEALVRDLRAQASGSEAASVSGRQAEDFEWTADSRLSRIERDMGAMPTRDAQTAPEAEKAAEQAEESAPVAPAIAAAEQKIAAESPVVGSPDGTNASARPNPAVQGEFGTVPAHAAQKPVPVEKSADEIKPTPEETRAAQNQNLTGESSQQAIREAPEGDKLTR
ncbi:MAG: NADH-quinone oxidoreductase subunit NuoE [Chloroflexaceae bacterium]|jgi:NADH-quinone oxidoreductase subunit E|nr:NADH-quinone oxidoreductase subunit NuoE [Chloroflexaceae bacterium]